MDADYFHLAQKSIPRLAALYPDFTGNKLEMETSYSLAPEEDEKKMGPALAEAASPYRVRNSEKSVLPAKRLKHTRR